MPAMRGGGGRKEGKNSLFSLLCGEMSVALVSQSALFCSSMACLLCQARPRPPRPPPPPSSIYALFRSRIPAAVEKLHTL